MAENDLQDTDDEIDTRQGIGKYRRWFREAVDKADVWRKEAEQDYDFVAGKQWTEADKHKLEQSGRPAITINRIKPLINVLSGYQRLNRYDIDFLPRTSDDIDICTVRKGITKYVLDACGYDNEESQAFLDAAIGGLGWMEVGYKVNDDMTDGEAFVKRQDPFGIYVDPESHETDFSDAKYVCRAKWVDKDELKEVYPEHADAIEAQYEVYDTAEKTGGREVDDPLWYKRDLQKVRLVECWYKVKQPRTLYLLANGQTVGQEDMRPEYLMNGFVEGYQTVKATRVRVASFFDRVLLEDMDSPYQHGEIPFVPITCYYYGTGDVPAGFVRDLKDPQREINKRRIQTLHILNTSGNGGGWMEADAMDPKQKEDFRKNGNIPGHFSEVRPGALSGGKVQERAIQNPPAAVIQAESQATQDLTAISGINEALMGTDIPSSASGRAIELKQKQAITHIAPMFDQLRKAKKKIAYQLWGKRGHAGIIPQYYTEDKIYRVEGTNGQQFIHVNEQVIQQDPMGMTIVKTLNDLSEGEFDIVISDTEASTTQRQAQMWGLVDACKNLGVPGDMIFDIIIDLSDLPNKEDIKQRWQQRQEAQQQTSQQQMQLEMIKNQNMNQSIAFKDAPLPIQFAMAAKQGLIDPQIAQYAVNMMVQQMFPQLAQQMQAQEAQKAQEQAAQQQQLAQAIQAQQSQQQTQDLQQQGGGMTQAAAQSMQAGAAPAAM